MAAPRYSGQNVSAVKSRNIRAILMNLLYNEPGYRVKLARDISVSTTTVTKLVEELIEQGIVEERLDEVDGPRSVGRPQNAIYLARDARQAVGVHIGGGIYRIAIVNLRNEILFHRMGAYDIKAPADVVLNLIGEEIGRMLDEHMPSRESVIGVGVGAPGLVNFKTGVIGFSKNQGWRNVTIGSQFTIRLNLPVVVENNVRAMALGEALFGSGRDVNTLLFLYGRLGVAAGIVVDRHIYRGINLGAGEIGHTFIVQQEYKDGSLKAYRTLEELVSAPTLIAQAQLAASQHPESILGQTLQAAVDNEALERIFEAARQADPHAKQIVETSARCLGLALVNAINFINPELILLGGMFAQGEDLYLPVIRQMVDQLAFAGMGERVEICSTSFGWRAGLLGASALALAHFFYLPPEVM